MGEKIPEDPHGDESPWEYVIRTQFGPQMHYTFSNYSTNLLFKFIPEHLMVSQQHSHLI